MCFQTAQNLTFPFPGLRSIIPPDWRLFLITTQKGVVVMNTKIADFVSKRTDPYFFSPQEDANLTAIHTEVKRSIESATDELTFD